MLFHRGVPDNVSQFEITLPLSLYLGNFCLLQSSGTPSSAASSSWCSLPQRYRVCCLATCCSAFFCEKLKKQGSEFSSRAWRGVTVEEVAEGRMNDDAGSIELKSYHITLFFWNSSPKLVRPSTQKTAKKRNVILLHNQPSLSVQWNT